jgi:mRNA interferase MazF
MTPMPPTTPSKLVANDNLKFGDIVLVRFPFTDQQTSKQRPAVVVSGSVYNLQRPDVVLLAVTSQLFHSSNYAHSEIVNWKTAGLLKASLIKPVIATIEQALIVRLLGSLSGLDLSGLERVLRDIRFEPSTIDAL